VTTVSSESLAIALIEGPILAKWRDVNISSLPTPCLFCFSTHCKHIDACSGHSSHNHQGYNGLKIVINDKTLSGDTIQGIYHRIPEFRLY